MGTVDALTMGRKTFETVRDRGFGEFGRFKGQGDVMRVPQILTSSPIMNPVSKSPKWGLWGMRWFAVCCKDGTDAFPEFGGFVFVGLPGRLCRKHAKLTWNLRRSSIKTAVR